MSVLALQYRPKSFADVVGQGHIKPVLRAMVKSADMPPALIFGGPRGTGKTTCARVLAAALNCVGEHAVGDACGTCAQCLAVQQSNNTSVLEVDAASNGGVDEVRRIKDMCLYSHEAEWRLVLFDEAHSMSKEAFNALLKLLEEPPEKTVFVLLTTETDKILDTVVSRSMLMDFRRISQADLVSRLRHIAEAEKIEIEDELLGEIANRAQGGLRDAVMLLDQTRRVNISGLEEFREAFGIFDYSLPMMWSAVRGDYAEGYRLVGEFFSKTGDAQAMVADLSRLVSELLVIKSGGRPSHLTAPDLAERVTLAKAVSVQSLVRVVEVLWDLRDRVRETEQFQRSSMELGFALVVSGLGGEAAKTADRPILESTSESKTLDLAEIRESLGAL